MNEIKSTRIAFMSAFEELAAADDSFVLVSADSLAAMRALDFAKKYPQKVFDVGIAEQNAVGVAAGLAATGLRPYICTYAGFLTMRACEQIRTFIAYPNLDVKIIGLNGGVYGGEREGVTHQTIEDIAIMRAIPNLTVICPCDADETAEAIKAIAYEKGPIYVRIGSGKEAVFDDAPPPFVIGAVREIANYGHDAAILSTGFTLGHALKALVKLKAQGIDAQLHHVATIKPLDEQAILAIGKTCKHLITVEDHTIYGGLGGAVAEVIAQSNCACVQRVGIRDVFPSSGPAEVLLDAYGLSADDIVAAVMKSLQEGKTPATVK